MRVEAEGNSPDFSNIKGSGHLWCEPNDKGFYTPSEVNIYSACGRLTFFEKRCWSLGGPCRDRDMRRVGTACPAGSGSLRYQVAKISSYLLHVGLLFYYCGDIFSPHALGYNMNEVNKAKREK